VAFAHFAHGSFDGNFQAPVQSALPVQAEDGDSAASLEFHADVADVLFDADFFQQLDRCSLAPLDGQIAFRQHVGFQRTALVNDVAPHIENGRIPKMIIGRKLAKVGVAQQFLFPLFVDLLPQFGDGIVNQLDGIGGFRLFGGFEMGRHFPFGGGNAFQIIFRLAQKDADGGQGLIFHKSDQVGFVAADIQIAHHQNQRYQDCRHDADRQRLKKISVIRMCAALGDCLLFLKK